MKKVITILSFSILICILSCLSAVVYAEDIGYTKHTDVVTYINHYPIASFNYNSTTLICAEDLQHVGFDIKWNEYRESITISRAARNNVVMQYVFRPTREMLGKDHILLKTTNITAYIGDYQIAAYGGIDGYTLINVEDLAAFSMVDVFWVPDSPAMKVWVSDGLEMLEQEWALRELDPSMSYYTNCKKEGVFYCIDWVDTPESLTLSFVQMDNDGNYYCCNLGKLYIIDVIDSNGNSRDSSPNMDNYMYSPYADYTNAPYFYGMTDYKLATSITLKNSAAPLGKMSESVGIFLNPATAEDPGGLIKFRYYCICWGTYMEDSFRVNTLPD